MTFDLWWTLKGQIKVTYDFLSVVNINYTARKNPFEDTAVWKYHDLDLTFQGHEGKWKFTYDFLSVVSSNYMARKQRFKDTAVWKYSDLDLTF